MHTCRTVPDVLLALTQVMWVGRRLQDNAVLELQDVTYGLAVCLQDKVHELACVFLQAG
jgi:hypothetical protein